jgi:hypothetical protein
MDFYTLKPNFLLKNSSIQTILASFKPKSLQKNSSYTNSTLQLIKLKSNYKLLGYYSENKTNKGFIILLHGWEGSSDSSYVLRTSEYFFEKGYSIFRYNFQDHGNTHHLNEGLFHGNLLKENVEAIESILKNYAGKKQSKYIIGFSLGGNYAIRIGIELSKKNQFKVNHIFSISPAIDPENSTMKMDSNSFLRKFFLKEWKNSLLMKQKLFPYIYNFEEDFQSKTIMELTENVVVKYSNYSSAKEYFNAYKIKNQNLKQLNYPLTIITSKDDPICDYRDLEKIEFNQNYNILLTNYGGHNGFFEDLHLNCFYNRYILEKISTT